MIEYDKDKLLSFSIYELGIVIVKSIWPTSIMAFQSKVNEILYFAIKIIMNKMNLLNMKMHWNKAHSF